VDVHLVDGTYELFRQHFGQPSRLSSDGSEVAATRGVLTTVLSMIEGGATFIGVATDHVIESFRNDLWLGYKTSKGVPAELLAQFPLLEAGLVAMGVTVWPMIELEADDAIASVAVIAAEDVRVHQIRIYSPDKDLAQCVRSQRVVQVDRRSGAVIDESGVWEKFGVAPTSIADWLALVGDAADGFPGLPGWGKRSAAQVLAHYGSIDAIPDTIGEWNADLRRAVRGSANLAVTLAAGRHLALLFRELATLRVDRSLLHSVETLQWRGPSAEFDEVGALLRDARLVQRAAVIASSRLGH
jgi:5'-3' exonuclease